MRLAALARDGLDRLPIAGQLARVEGWALAQGHELVRLRRSQRRRTGSSPTISIVLDACRRGVVDAVGVVDLTRLGCSRGVVAAVLMLLRDAGVRVALVGDGSADVYSANELWGSEAMVKATDRLIYEENMAWIAHNEGRIRRPSALDVIGRSAPTTRRKR